MLRAIPRKPVTPERIGRFRQFFESTALAPPEGTSVEHIMAGTVPAVWIRNGDADPRRRLLYLHGGAYLAGSSRTHACLAAHLSRAARVSVLVPEYRLAPEHPFPAAVDDCLATFRWMRTHGPAAPGEARHLYVAGDSAGGGLTFATLLSTRDAREPMPDAAVTLSAWTDLTGSGDSMKTRAAADPFIWPEGMTPCAELYLAGKEATSPLASPLNADLRGLCPLLMQVGDAEILLDDTLRTARSAEEADVSVEVRVFPELFHVFQMYAGAMPEATEAVDEIAGFLGRHAR